MAEKTLQMGVDNMGFLLKKLNSDCEPLQYLRELTVNAIEAIHATPERTGEIEWRTNQFLENLTESRKLCIVDTGCGMTGEEMRKYLNQLSASGREQGLQKNFGVGGKISACVRNPVGVEYVSWKEGKGAHCKLWTGPDGKIGLKLLADGYNYWEEIGDDVKEPPIEQHGTIVTLHGESDAADTVTAPPGAPGPHCWIARYLNTRFFRIPNGITIRAQDADGQMRRVQGAKELLDKFTSLTPRKEFARGEVELEQATVNWWILSEERKGDRTYFCSAGHCAAIYKDEIYDMRSGAPRLQRFGVVVGHSRVVIYVQPRMEVYSNIARGTLRHGENEELPWDQWADEFRALMPQILKDYIAEILNRSASDDSSEEIRKRLKSTADLYLIPKAKPSKRGPLRVDDPEEGSSETGTGYHDGPPKPPSDDKSEPRPTGPKPGDVYSIFAKTNGNPAINVLEFPDVSIRWVPEHELPEAGRAASYQPADNLLLINEEFRIYSHFRDRWIARYDHVQDSAPTVTARVRNWYEQILVEVVYTTNSLRGSSDWDAVSIQKLYSPEALTAAVLPRWHTDKALQEDLRRRLGPAKTTRMLQPMEERCSSQDET